MQFFFTQLLRPVGGQGAVRRARHRIFRHAEFRAEEPGHEVRLPARRGFEGLKGYVDTDGTVRNCCVGTGAQDTMFDYYARPMPPNDPHAPGPVIMAGAEMLMMDSAE